MSMEEMDIDRSPPSAQPNVNPPSPEKKRKLKEKDHQSSKRRKHEDHLEAVIATDASGQPLGEGKTKKKKAHREDRGRSTSPHTPAPSSQRKHKKSREVNDYSTPPSAQPLPRGQRGESHLSTHLESPTASRKPLANTTAVQSLQSDTAASPFQLITSTLYLPLSPISISPTHALSSLLVEHVSPLLLTYYPPLRGIILAYSNPSISSCPPSTSSPPSKSQDLNPQPLTLATTANEYGVLYVYLTATFLIFRPERGQTLEGWINVQSEGFLGAVVFNLFSVGIERSRLPAGWKWVPPGQNQDSRGDRMDTSSESGYPTTANTTEAEESDSDKENHFKPLPSSASVNFDDPAATLAEEEDEASSGYFQTPSGKRVRGTIRFRVKDIDVIPGSDKDKGFLSIEGTMLNEEEEAKLVGEERKRFAGPKGKSTSSQERRENISTPTLMSGGLISSRLEATPSKSKTAPKRAKAASKKTDIPKQVEPLDENQGESEKFQRKKSIVVRKKGTVPAATL
jgi:DNA-directed RNA polymerase I subunit RPA43